MPVSMSSLSSLTRLSLGQNNFRGSIPASFGNLSELSELFMGKNKLIGSIPFELGRLFKLRFLRLSSNNLTGMVPPQLYNMSSLRVVSLSVNQLHGTLAPDFDLALQINLEKNAINGPTPKSLGNLNDLEIFTAFDNSLGTNSGNELHNIMNTLSNCSNLRELSLGANNFSGLLPLSMANLSKFLSYFDLQENYISGSIPVGIENLLNLQLFSVGDNMFSGSIPESIRKLSKLEQIWMYRNKLSGKIPSSIGNLSQLSILALAENKLKERIPDSLGNCKRLLAIDLDSNKLTGMIPGPIFELSSLSIGLFLGGNQLTGPIPMQIGNIRNLGTLNLSENKLSGGIPETLSNFQGLEFLSLAGNHFEGTIPKSLNQLKGIQFLDLSSNNLSGQIPKFLGELNLLQSLNLSYNMFEGEVPIDGLFKNISAFSVVGNSKLCGGVEELRLLASEACRNGVATLGSQNGGPNTLPTMVNQSMAIMTMPAVGTPGGVPGPTTNLNIGMDYWGTATPPILPALHGKASPAPVARGMVTAGSRDSIQSQLWLQDERESARRSRLRKQAECDELAQRAEALNEENASLRLELSRIRNEYDQLLAQNASLKERLGEEVPGQEDDHPVGNDTQQTGQT
ncbi:hypothetical protein RHSIM_Rhsim07G0133000 [Rhododendron simsii]|uniref:non-specific serine/threonine protein kinase n=1 Tax=Rhododendron simsii TaxID=118357 RepID=A0A834GVK6_RHOSS|nr:hypothetical protein RHSIM_Rhsim07G0133000 [Rhododendron simsii]